MGSINCVSARIHKPSTMKIVIVLAALAAVCLAENCSQDSDCVLTVCGTGQRIDCYRRDDSHVCTCMPTHGSSGSGVTCNTPDQCKSNYGDCTRRPQVALYRQQVQMQLLGIDL